MRSTPAKIAAHVVIFVVVIVVMSALSIWLEPSFQSTAAYRSSACMSTTTCPADTSDL
jgi:hypothetical protein